MELTARLLRQAIGLDVSDVAGLTSHAEADIIAIEDSGGSDGRYDEYISDLVEIHGVIDELLERAVEAVEEDPAVVGGSEPVDGGAAVFVIYDADSDLVAAHGSGGLFSGSSVLHRLIIARIILMLELEEIPTVAVAYNRQDCDAWLKEHGYEDGPVGRNEWASASADRG